MNTKRIGFTVVGALLAALVVLTLRSDDDAARVRSDAHAAAESEGSSPLEPVPTHPAVSPSRVRVTRNDAPPETIEGRIEIEHPDGSRRPGGSGVVRLRLPNDRGDTACQVASGRFDVAAVRGTPIRPVDAVLDGRTITFDGPTTVPREGPLVLIGQAGPGILLHVVDASTAAPLEAVTLAWTASWGNDRDVRPSLDLAELQPLFERSPSPLEIPADGRLRHCWVRADGYAWGRIRLECSRPDEHTLRLARGGTILVTCEFGESRAPFVVRLRDGREADRESCVEFAPAAPGEFVSIDGLPCGAWIVSAEIGDPADSCVLDSVEVELAPAASERVLLRPRSSPIAPPPVPVAGSLHLPSSREAAGASLELSLIGRPSIVEARTFSQAATEMTPLGGDAYRFDAGLLSPGTYSYVVKGVGTRHWDGEVDVVAPATLDLRIVVGEPAALSIRVVDAATEQNIRVDAVLANDSSGLHFATAAEESGDVRYHVDCVPGSVRLSLFDDRYDGEFELRAEPGKNDVTIRAIAATTIVVSFNDGETTVPFNHESGISARRVDGDGSSTGGSFDGRRATIIVSSPGLYELSVERLDGFLPIPPQRIQVLAGEPAELVVAVERDG